MQFNGSYYTINFDELGKRLGEEGEADRAKGGIAGTYIASKISDKGEKELFKSEEEDVLRIYGYFGQ